MTRRSVCLVALLVAGCLPRYQPAAGGAYGYSEHELSPGIYRVDYQYDADPFFPYRGPTFDQLVLLRSADLTLERGYSHFIVDTNALPGAYWGGRSLTIKLFTQAPSRDGVKVYDARAVASAIRARYSYLAN